MATPQSTVTYRDIPGFPGYRVGDDGSVWGCRSFGYGKTLNAEWRRLKLHADSKGYLTIGLCRDDGGRKVYRVHRLVLDAFVGPRPDGAQCCHGDGDKTNNRLSNLRWDTNQANQMDRAAHGTSNRGERCAAAKLTREQVLQIRQNPENLTSPKLAARFGCSAGAVRAIWVRKSWGWL